MFFDKSTWPRKFAKNRPAAFELLRSRRDHRQKNCDGWWAADEPPLKRQRALCAVAGCHKQNGTLKPFNGASEVTQRLEYDSGVMCSTEYITEGAFGQPKSDEQCTGTLQNRFWYYFEICIALYILLFKKCAWTNLNKQEKNKKFGIFVAGCWSAGFIEVPVTKSCF